MAMGGSLLLRINKSTRQHAPAILDWFSPQSPTILIAFRLLQAHRFCSSPANPARRPALMTKYILHGGKPSKPSQGNRRFYEQLFMGLEGRINLLCVYFARDPKAHDWPQMLEEDKQCVSSFCPDLQIDCTLGSDQMAIFPDQIAKADVIFLKGGDTTALLSTMQKWPAIELFWKNKVVAGSSAGALVLSDYYYDGDLDTCNHGLGLLPIKLVCHWSNARINAIEKLRRIGSDIEIVRLPEEHYIVYQWPSQGLAPAIPSGRRP